MAVPVDRPPDCGRETQKAADGPVDHLPGFAVAPQTMKLEQRPAGPPSVPEVPST